MSSPLFFLTVMIQAGYQKALIFTVLLWTHLLNDGRHGARQKRKGKQLNLIREGSRQLWKSQEMPLALRRQRIKKPPGCLFFNKEISATSSRSTEALDNALTSPRVVGDQRDPRDGPSCSSQEPLTPSRGWQCSPSSLWTFFRFCTCLDWRKNSRKNQK